MGLSFPLLLRVTTQSLGNLGRRLGSGYAINTVGAIVGALAVLVAAVGITPQPFLAHTNLITKQHRILYHEEGHTATVVVARHDSRFPRQNGLEMFVNLLGMSVLDEERFHQQHYASVALLPIALHPKPSRVFVAGLASGVTTGAAALDERVGSVTCVEISPEVLHAAALLDSLTYHATTNPRIRNVVDDARAYLETTADRYDVIVTDAFLSALTGTTALYSRDFFQLCRRRLAPGGLMSIGVGRLHGVDRTVARAFIEAFPEVAVLRVPTMRAYCMTYLIGSNAPITVSRAAVEGVYRQRLISAELACFHFPDAEALLSSYLGSGQELLAFIRDVPVCTDDRPVVDLQAFLGSAGCVLSRDSKGLGLMDIARELGGTRQFPNLVE